MKEKNINFELQGKVRKYLEYLMHSETDTKKENEVLNVLTTSLKRELILESNGKYINDIPLLKENFSKNTLEELAFYVNELKLSPEEFIYHVKFIVFVIILVFCRRMILMIIPFLLLLKEILIASERLMI